MTGILFGLIGSNISKIKPPKSERLVPCPRRFPYLLGIANDEIIFYNFKIFLNMQQANEGDKVKVHYHGRLSTGETFDSSEGRDPLEFTVGAGQMIKGFDDGVKGMQVGDKKTVEINADDAYGQRDAGNLIEFPKDQFPPNMNAEVGMQLMLSNDQGQQFPVVVVEVKEESVVLDANHPLAGQDLIFDIEMMDIQSKSRIIMP